MPHGAPCGESNSQMTPRRKMEIAILALVACGVLAIVLWPEPPEPVFNGRKLSQWVVDSMPGQRSALAAQAIDTIGTNGIPYYLKWIRYQPGVLKVRSFQLAEKGRRWLG